MRSSVIVIPTATVRRVVLALVVLLLLAGAILAARQLRLGVSEIFAPDFAGQIDHNAYQGVFLTGGQVFFGKAEAHGDYLALSDVFYLSAGSEQQQSQLIKRGQEVHGPREPMLIELRQVLYLENLRDDSQIVQLIKRFKSGEQPAPPASSTATPPPQAPPTGTVRPSASR